MMRGDLAGRDIDRDGRTPRADIDTHDRAARSSDGIGQEGKLLAFGVGGADHIDALHARFPVVRHVRLCRPPSCPTLKLLGKGLVAGGDLFLPHP
ncbi:hypothetical protein EOA25_12675 [Mesorhizobium sp. M2A.F.Ca.ET.040.01.1.1]|nr:hypothetical protein EOA25_12675 [Mesorhizobium sp. M2A.F.Ca.ET.040.01.1.1]